MYAGPQKGCHGNDIKKGLLKFKPLKYMDISKNSGVYPPKWMVKIMEENPIKMDDLGGVPIIFGLTPISCNVKNYSTGWGTHPPLKILSVSQQKVGATPKATFRPSQKMTLMFFLKVTTLW